MTRKEALTLLALAQEQAVVQIQELARKARLWEQSQAEGKDTGDQPSPTTPSGMTAPYEKPAHRKRNQKSGQNKGHTGARRPSPDHIDETHDHTLDQCPDCGQTLGESCREHSRIIEDIPPVTPQVHQHRVNGYWCGHCRKMVTPTVTDALPRATLGLNVLVYSAWLHYLLGVSVGNIAHLLSVGYAFKVSPGGLTQAWANLATWLETYYEQIEQQIRESGVLHADETGWRINGLTHWLWAFCTERLCYYLIDQRRSSAVVARVLGEVFDGILITDFYGAYNLVEAWAKQRCFFHLFTELIKVDKRNRYPPWRAFRRRLSRLLKDAMRLNLQRAELDDTVFTRRKCRLKQRLDQLPREGPRCVLSGDGYFVSKGSRQRNRYLRGRGCGGSRAFTLLVLSCPCGGRRCAFPPYAGSPWQNPYVERLIGSIRRECLDHVIVFNAPHLKRLLRSYLTYYHGARTHLALAKRCPESRPVERLGREILSCFPMSAASITSTVAPPDFGPTIERTGRASIRPLVETSHHRTLVGKVPSGDSPRDLLPLDTPSRHIALPRISQRFASAATLSQLPDRVSDRDRRAGPVGRDRGGSVRGPVPDSGTTDGLGSYSCGRARKPFCLARGGTWR